MIAEQLGMDKMVVHKIISEDLVMRKICAKLVPKVLTDVQKQDLRPRDKTSEERMAPSAIASTEESSHVQVENESNVDCLL
ncbi:hypothetical protein TNCV_3992001 [Trichonephila clavipes]|uniref:Uncharacterized protein n=1 Tax=Trichonephila clavipes TaxID=2585209 RepID=A0A8X6T663_TRICX|nr:hypothetical protein TNCV_3992001 [Trichonephila clavipes]